jgi:uncharacterized protein with GYD domain
VLPADVGGVNAPDRGGVGDCYGRWSVEPWGLGTDREENPMTKYLVKGNYVGDGVAGLLREGGSSRRDAARAAIESVGGSLESMYYAFGDVDVYGVCEFPDEASATAFSLLVNSSGAVALSLTPLMSPEDVDAASSKAGTYRAPGT